MPALPDGICDNMIELRAILSTDLATDHRREILGYHVKGDFGGGVYVYDSTANEDPNNGSIVAPLDLWEKTTSGQWANGRWYLQHYGVVTTKQFGAPGIDEEDPMTLFDAVSADLLDDEDEVRETYKAKGGGVFSGLLYSSTDADCDTMDWAATEKAIEWCAANGVRLEVPAGVYFLRRPLWLGDDSFVPDPGKEADDKSIAQMGFTMLGQTSSSRQQADGGVANLRLVQDCANRFCLSMSEPTNLSSFKLLVKFLGEASLTDDLDAGSTGTEIIAALNEVLGPVDLEAVLQDTSGSDQPAARSIFFQVQPEGGPPDRKFVGEILAVNPDYPDEPKYTDFVHCFPDSAVVSFRRSAGVRMRLENVTLKGNPHNDRIVGEETVPDTRRFASFGVLFVTTQFVGHELDRIGAYYVDTSVGILKGTGNNGENTRVDRLAALSVRRMLYTNAPQAFQQEFFGWVGTLTNIPPEGEDPPDLTGLVYAEFDEAGDPGFGAVFHNASATFSSSALPESDGTVVTVRRGTGIVQFTGGRFEHTARIFHYDAVNAGQKINNNMDVIFRGVEFTCVGGGDRRLVDGDNVEEIEPSSDDGTQYGLFVEDCTFHTFDDDEHPEYGDLILEGMPEDKLRCVFEKCRFLGVRSLQQRTSKAAFRKCYKNDFLGAGKNDSPLREFSDEPPTPGVRTQSLRNAWQDTPWIQTGPRFNALKNADLRDQERSVNATDYVDLAATGWTVLGSSDDVVFGKWGDFAEANINPGPESFYLGIKNGSTVRSVLDFIPLDYEGPKVITYQCLCRVDGKALFRLENTNDPDIVYDEILLEHSGGMGDLTLVTLRMQLHAAEAAGDCRLSIKNPDSSGSALAVVWQQAWGGTDEGGSSYPLAGGLANAGFARTPGGTVVPGTYPWAVNALGIRASSRFQLPLLDTKPTVGETAGGDAENMGWKSPVSATDYDLIDGEMNYDDWQKAVLARMEGDWYCLQKPERVSTNPSTPLTWVAGTEKSVVYTGSGASAIDLTTDFDTVALGTVVRVFNFRAFVLGNSVTVTFGGSGSFLVAANSMCEFVFYNDGGTPRWLVTQFQVAAAKKP